MYCKQFALGPERQIDEAYIKTGKLRMEFKQFVGLGKESEYAAQASLCAAEQGKFYEYADKLFREQKSPNSGAYSKSNLKSYARERGLGLDGAAFDSCVDSEKYRDRVQAEDSEGRKRGITGTPTFFLDGEMITGALPFSEFQKRIDEKLSKQE